MKILGSSLLPKQEFPLKESTVNPALEEGFAGHCLNPELCWQTQQKQHCSTTV